MEKKLKINKLKLSENGKLNTYQLPHDIEVTDPTTIIFPFVLFTDVVEGLKDDLDIKTVEEYIQEHDTEPEDDLFGYVLPFPFRNVMDLSRDYWPDSKKANLLVSMLVHYYQLPIIPDEEDQ